MSGLNDQEIPIFPEVDKHGGDELPSYEDLAAQNGPNSRFGRWRGWIEKRAAERYADLTPEDFERRRQRGWGEGVPGAPLPETDTGPSGPTQPLQHPNIRLHIQTDLSEPLTPPGLPEIPEPAPSIGELLAPSHLKLHNFGSRFLPHTTSQIRCLLPLLGNTLLLIGHDDGLSVLNMQPKEWGENGLVEKGPGEAEARQIWIGEGVYQMTLLEAESTGDGTPQGVVLALVGPEGDSPKDQEGIRTIRMYNLSSLISLVKWAIIQQPGVLPLHIADLPVPKPAHTHISPKKLQRQRPGGLAKGLKNLKLESPVPQSAYGRELNPPIPEYLYSSGKSPSKMTRQTSQEMTPIDSSWDVVEELPIRWATDYVPLAAQGTRLYNSPVLFYDLWRDPNEPIRGVAFLAVAIKSNILLYQAPKGERAFHFVKEFYTPITAHDIAFVQQSTQDISRSPSDVTPRPLRAGPHHFGRHAKNMSVGGVAPQFYPPMLSLFVIFEKKAGLIRIADAAVGEVDLYDENSNGSNGLLSASASSSTGRRSRSSWDGRGFVKESKATWITPTEVNLSGPSPSKRHTISQRMYLLTRGKHSHFLPCPLPANLPSVPPYRTIHWTSVPTHVYSRVCHPPDDTPPFLQVIAFGGGSIEIQEISLSSLSERKGKGKGRAEEVTVVQADAGGETGFLVRGGHWHHPFFPDLSSSPCPGDLDTLDSDDDLSPDELINTMQAQEGVYGWVRKGVSDWRIFWLGGSGAVCED